MVVRLPKGWEHFLGEGVKTRQLAFSLPPPLSCEAEGCRGAERRLPRGSINSQQTSFSELAYGFLSLSHSLSLTAVELMGETLQPGRTQAVWRTHTGLVTWQDEMTPTWPPDGPLSAAGTQKG